MFFVDKRHWREFGIITCFFLDKRQWPEYGIIATFFVDKRHWPEFGITTCFLWIKGTVLSLVLLRVFCRQKALA